jgi:hypothetical protein
MGADLKHIVHSAQQLSDWRYYVRKFPWLCVGSAFALGLLIAPNRRKAGSVEWEKLAAQVQKARLADLGVTGSVGQGLARKLLAVAGPIAARTAVNFLAHRFGERTTAGGDEEHGQTFESMGKPR